MKSPCLGYLLLSNRAEIIPEHLTAHILFHIHYCIDFLGKNPVKHIVIFSFLFHLKDEDTEIQGRWLFL